MKNKIMTTGLKCAVFYYPVLLSLYMYMDDQEDDEVYSLHRLYRCIQIYTEGSKMWWRILFHAQIWTCSHVTYFFSLLSTIFVYHKFTHQDLKLFDICADQLLLGEALISVRSQSREAARQIFITGHQPGGGGVLPYAGNKSMCGPNLRTQIGYRI